MTIMTNKFDWRRYFDSASEFTSIGAATLTQETKAAWDSLSSGGKCRHAGPSPARRTFPLARR